MGRVPRGNYNNDEYDNYYDEEDDIYGDEYGNEFNDIFDEDEDETEFMDYHEKPVQMQLEPQYTRTKKQRTPQP